MTSKARRGAVWRSPLMQAEDFFTISNPWLCRMSPDPISGPARGWERWSDDGELGSARTPPNTQRVSNYVVGEPTYLVKTYSPMKTYLHYRSGRENIPTLKVENVPGTFSRAIRYIW